MILLEKWEHKSVPAVAQKAILIWMYMIAEIIPLTLLLDL